jgi:hypothetical protein
VVEDQSLFVSAVLATLPRILLTTFTQFCCNDDSNRCVFHYTHPSSTALKIIPPVSERTGYEHKWQDENAGCYLYWKALFLPPGPKLTRADSERNDDDTGNNLEYFFSVHIGIVAQSALSALRGALRPNMLVTHSTVAYLDDRRDGEHTRGCPQEFQYRIQALKRCRGGSRY